MNPNIIEIAIRAISKSEQLPFCDKGKMCIINEEL